MSCSALQDLKLDNSIDGNEQILKLFIEQNKQSNTFVELSAHEVRDHIWRTLHVLLTQEQKASFLELCLTTVCILSRDKVLINNEVVNDQFIDNLLRLASLKDNNPNLLENTAVIIASLKCLCNLVYNSSKVQMICSKNNAADGIVNRIRTYPDPNIPFDMKYFDTKLLFLITALIPETRLYLKTKLHAVTYLTEVLDFTLKNGNKSEKVDEDCMKLLSEILKVMFNLTIPKEKTEDEEESSIRLVIILRELLLFSQSSSLHDTICSDVINLLTNMPPKCLELLMPQEELQYNENPIKIILNFLFKKLSECPESKLNETLSPTLILLITLCREYKLIRREVCGIVLPPLTRSDVSHLPEEGSSFRAKLCKHMTSVHIHFRDLVTEFLFVLCKENVNRMVKYTGFGNSAGMMARHGLLAGRKGPTVYSSESEDSETEEYSECKNKINPVTARIEPEWVNPLASMTEEQKEYEAMKLVNAMDKLQREGVIQPCRIGEDGQPHPVEHILQLPEEIDKYKFKS